MVVTLTKQGRRWHVMHYLSVPGVAKAYVVLRVQDELVPSIVNLM